MVAIRLIRFPILCPDVRSGRLRVLFPRSVLFLLILPDCMTIRCILRKNLLIGSVLIRLIPIRLVRTRVIPVCHRFRTGFPFPGIRRIHLFRLVRRAPFCPVNRITLRMAGRLRGHRFFHRVMLTPIRRIPVR